MSDPSDAVRSLPLTRAGEPRQMLRRGKILGVKYDLEEGDGQDPPPS